MNEEVNAILQVYQQKLNTLLAQNIAYEAKIAVLTKQVKDKQELIDGGKIAETPVPPVDESQGE